MKDFKLYIICLTIGLITLASCDNGFDDLNTSKVRVNELDPIYLFNNALQASSPTVNTLGMELALVQQIVSPNAGVLAGGNFNQSNPGLITGNWDTFYTNVLKHLEDVIASTAGDADHMNLHNMAKILKCHGIMVVTDTYGDVPYSEAGKGYLDGLVAPVYDPQRDIYLSVLSTLDEAGSSLSNSNPIESSDALYNGDIVKWKRFCYSLMLRAALRIADQENAIAQTYITQAIEGGLMQSNDDNAVLRHDFNFFNPVGENLNAQEAANYYMTAEFVDYLRDNDDPRLASIAVRYIGATAGSDQSGAIAGNAPGIVISTDPADQIGLPMGNDNGTASALATSLGLNSFYEFTQVDRTRMVEKGAPAFLVTYSQTLLLHAEAIVRGFAVGTASSLYSEAIEAHMQQLAEYGEDVAIAQSDIDTYVLNNPLGANALEEINTQYWVSSFLNGPEAWANFRRSGYPDLAPNPYPTQDITGDFANRLPYPDSELSVNSGNLQEAIARQGFSGNNMDGFVWWDE